MYIMRNRGTLQTMFKLDREDYIVQNIETGEIRDFAFGEICIEDIVNIKTSTSGSRFLSFNIDSPIIIKTDSVIICYTFEDVFMYYNGEMYTTAILIHESGSIYSTDYEHYCTYLDIASFIHMYDNKPCFINTDGERVELKLENGILMSKSEFMRRVLL